MLLRFIPFRKLCVAGLLFASLASMACGRYRARHELKKTDCLAEILQRVDRRWIGNDRFFEENLLGSPYPEVRKWCALALGRIASPRSLPLLYRAIHGGSVEVRAASAFAIGNILTRDLPREQTAEQNPQAIAELRRLLEDSAIVVQMRAIEALGKIGSGPDAGEITRQLERILRRSTKSQAERAYISMALTALGRLKEPGTAPFLDNLVSTPDLEIRESASQARLLLQQGSAALLPVNQPIMQESQQPDPLSQLNKFGTSAGVLDPGPVESTLTESASRAIASSRSHSTIAVVRTTRGTFEIELFREDAPVTAANFIVAARQGKLNFTNEEDWRNRESGFVFEQVTPGQQIGGPLPESQAGLGWTSNGEINMRFFERGSVGIAVDRENPSKRRLFIALAPEPYLDGVHTCFGRIISGIQSADRIAAGDRILGISVKDSIGFLDYVRY